MITACKVEAPKAGDLSGDGLSVKEGRIVLDEAVPRLVKTNCQVGDAITWGGSEMTCGEPTATSSAVKWSDVRDVPAELADGRDADTLAGISCADGSILAASAGGWACQPFEVSLEVDTWHDRVERRGAETRTLAEIVEDLRERVRRLESPPGYVKIPSGRFTMGSAANAPGRFADELPPTTVDISRAFWLKRTEVTHTEWCEVMGCDPSAASHPGVHKGCLECPMTNVSFNTVVEYLNALSIQDGVTPCYTGSAQTWTFSGLDCDGYRLPTEAEWEYAARGNTITTFHSGDLTIADDVCDQVDPALDAIGWYCGNSESPDMECEFAFGVSDPPYNAAACINTHPVAQKMANAFGLYDMHGNVAEWTNDLYTGATDLQACGPPCVDPSRPSSQGNRI